MKKILILFASSVMLFSCSKKNCDRGFMGDDCDVQETPGSITANSADITDWPATKDDGSGWDDESAPDIYFKILQNGSEVYTSETINDVSDGSTLTFTSGMPFNISNVDDQFTIEVYDDDTALGIGFSDLMGTFGIDLYKSNNGFPEVIQVTDDGMVFVMHVDYNF